jgi:hypothetical protein
MYETNLRFGRVALVLISLVCGFVVLFSRTSAQNPTTPQTAPTERTVEQANKNIQVLKGLPESQLVPVMNYMGASLGVRCNYCHVNKDGNWDYASDEKGQKKTAREMITMLNGINKNTFHGNIEVSCYTCHRGKTSVAHTLAQPIPTPEPRPSPGAQAQQQRDTLPTAEQLVEKYYQALGGVATIEKLKSRVMTGTLTTVAGVELGYELTQSGPDQVLAVIKTPQAGIFQRGFDGRVGWEKNNTGVHDLSPEETAYLQRYPDIYKDIKLGEQFTRMNVVGKPKFDGRDVYLVRANTASGKREQLYFDAETGLLVRRITSTTTPVGIIPEQIDFADYRDVEGMKVPFTIRVSAIDPTYSVIRKFNEIKLNVPVDAKKFNKPV